MPSGNTTPAFKKTFLVKQSSSFIPNLPIKMRGMIFEKVFIDDTVSLLFMKTKSHA